MMGEGGGQIRAMDRDEFTIASSTGVEVTLDVAGAGSRAYAFVIDFHVRAILAFAWFVAVALLTIGHVIPEPKSGAPSVAYALGAVLPAFLIYFLYHPVLETVMRGRTPGKRAAGVRIVTTSGATPSIGAILIRNLFRLIDSLPMLYVVGIVSTVVTAQSVRIGDLAAGTLLVHDRGDALKSLVALGSLAGTSTLDTATLEVARDLLERWKTLEDSKRTLVARALLRRIEPTLDPGNMEHWDSHELRRRIEAHLKSGGR